MTEDPVTVAPDMDLEEAARIMLDNGFRHLPVVDGTTILGVVSLRRVLGGRRHPEGEHAAGAASETAPAPEAA
jgi:predicted transcriptional regulator